MRRSFVCAARLAAACVLIAVVFAVIRWRECRTNIPAGEIRFAELHSVTWTPASGELTRTGGDPYARLQLPPRAIPVARLTLECSGGGPPSAAGFYIYQYPYHLPSEVISEKRVAAANLTGRPGGYDLSWDLTESKLARIDLPDDLGKPIRIERIILQTSFANAGRWSFLGFVVASLAGFAIAGGTLLTRVTNRWRAGEALAYASLLVGSVALAQDIPFEFVGTAGHDDALFVSQAASILDGRWLGHYNELTLSKGPAYPLFLAASSRLALPLRTSQALLYGVAAIAFVWSLRRLVPSPGLRLLVLAALLFQANAYSSAAVGRVLRSGIQPGLTLLTLAGAIGLASSYDRSKRAMLVWSVITGIAGAAFWYSREEGVWLLPALGLLLAVAAFSVLRMRPRHWARLAFLALPFVIVAATAAGLRARNARNYGAAIVVDAKDGYFPRAYGALVRITPKEFIPGVPVTRETRLRAYAVSPAFAELQAEMEGAIARGWNQYGWDNVQHPAARTEIRGGWFQWALRQAAAVKGHYRDAAASELYWRTVARELNRAADQGRIEAGGWRKGFFPRWDESLWRPFLHSLALGWERATQITDFGLEPNPSVGTAGQQAPFARISHQVGMTESPRPGLRTHVRLALSLLFRWLAVVATILASVATVWLAWRCVRGPECRRALAVLLAILGSAAALIVVVALVDVTSFSALFSIYLAPATPLIVAWWILSIAWAWAVRPRSLGVSTVTGTRISKP